MLAAEEPSARSALASGGFRRAAFGGRARVSQLATRVLQMGPHEPLELLQLGRVADQDVLSDRIEVVGFMR